LNPFTSNKYFAFCLKSFLSKNIKNRNIIIVQIKDKTELKVEKIFFQIEEKFIFESKEFK
jgi:hypothetical protein